MPSQLIKINQVIKQRQQIINQANQRSPFFYTDYELDFLKESQEWLDKQNSRQLQIQRLQEELAELQVSQTQLSKSDDKWWQLDAQKVAIKLVLINLTSLCQSCGQEGAEFSQSDGEPICWKCLTEYVQHQEIDSLLTKLNSYGKQQSPN